jgi:hypothetical protein
LFGGDGNLGVDMSDKLVDGLNRRAFELLQIEMQRDSDYAWTWHCSIAMAFQDAGGSPATSNVAAARFMTNCFGVDTSSLPQAEDSADAMYPPHIQRVMDERMELENRKTKLEDFIADNPIFKTLSGEERDRMIRQQKAMQEYHSILEERITGFLACP